MNEIEVNASPDEFAAILRSNGRRRAAFMLDAERGVLKASDPLLGPLAKAMNENARDFQQHQAVFLEIGESSGALLSAFLHRTSRGQGAGGVRHWAYQTMADLLSDGLRLSRGMTRKNALAGLWWGGGKGIIAAQSEAATKDPSLRAQLYQDYGRFITSLRGAYVTAEDVGTRASDMGDIFRTTRFATCVPESVGGSGNPSESTARGVVAAMEAALLVTGESKRVTEDSQPGSSHFQAALGAGATLPEGSFNLSAMQREVQHSVLQGKRIAMQGAGNVARFMMGHLLRRGVSQIVAAEVSEAAIAEARATHVDTRLILKKVAPTDRSIFAEPCDVFVPNALGGILNPETIPMLRTPLVCGAANNQLLDAERDSEALKQRGITHVPDFLANRMGIVNCANEQYGILPNDPAVLRHFDPAYAESVQSVTRRVLTRSRQGDLTPSAAANLLADELAEQPHPMWPGRTTDIITSLSRDGWHRG